MGGLATARLRHRHLRRDPVIAGQTVKWLRNRAPVVAQQPWFLAVNFVNPHDVSDDHGGRGAAPPRPNLAEAMVVRPSADIPLYTKQWNPDIPSDRR